MRSTFAVGSALLGLASAGGVTGNLTPEASTPSGCKTSYDGKFEISVAQAASKRALSEKRGECGAEGVLVMTLQDGVLKDAQDRIGYIASNRQFQFDGPPQAGAIYTGGFSVCEGDVLALGDSKTFYRCLSGDFYNLYDKNWAEQCEPVDIVAMGCGGTTSEIDDGQVVGTSVIHTTIVTALSDGQPQVVTTTMGVPMCQIGDGQVQMATTPCASVTPTTTAVPVSQSSDGQVEMPTSAPAPAPTTTAIPVSQSSDGQVEAPTGYPTAAPSSEAPSSEAPSSAPPAVPSSTAELTSIPVSQTPNPSITPSASSSATTTMKTSATTTAPAETQTTAPAPSSPPDNAAGKDAAAPGALILGLLAAFVAI